MYIYHYTKGMFGMALLQNFRVEQLCSRVFVVFGYKVAVSSRNEVF
jgi:hypothetical protein